MTSNEEELEALARIIAVAFTDNREDSPVVRSRKMARAVLAAGYRVPDQLPEWTVPFRTDGFEGELVLQTMEQFLTRQRVADAIERQYAHWLTIDPENTHPDPPLHSEQWIVKQIYRECAEIARTGRLTEEED